MVRKDAPTIELTGNVDVNQATDIPSGYSIRFTDLEDKSWETSITDGTYQIELAIGDGVDVFGYCPGLRLILSAPIKAASNAMAVFT